MLGLACPRHGSSVTDVELIWRWWWSSRCWRPWTGVVQMRVTVELRYEVLQIREMLRRGLRSQCDVRRVKRHRMTTLMLNGDSVGCLV